MRLTVTKWIVLLLCAFALLVGCIFFFGNEPFADGKLLSTWLQEGIYYHAEDREPSAPTLAEIETAIRKIGPRAVPVLLKKIQARDPAWKPMARNFAQKHERLEKWVRFSSASEQHNLAAYGFRVLNTEAISALPLLTIMLFDTNAPPEVYQCLAGIGLPSLPALKRAFTNSDPVIRYRAFNACRWNHLLAKELLDEVKSFRADTNVRIARTATSLTIELSSREETTSLVSQALEDSRPEVINAGLYWVRKIGTNARPVIPQLTNLFAHPDEMTRTRATGTLKIIDPVAAFAAGVNTNPPSPVTADPVQGMRRRGRFGGSPAK